MSERPGSIAAIYDMPLAAPTHAGDDGRRRIRRARAEDPGAFLRPGLAGRIATALQPIAAHDRTDISRDRDRALRAAGRAAHPVSLRRRDGDARTAGVRARAHRARGRSSGAEAQGAAAEIDDSQMVRQVAAEIERRQRFGSAQGAVHRGRRVHCADTSSRTAFGHSAAHYRSLLAAGERSWDSMR